jgi:hypothetical protein
VLLLFMGGAITIAVALTAMPVFRRHGDRLAALLVVLSAVNLALHAVENGTLLSMLSLSRAYAERGGADASLFHGLGMVVGSARRVGALHAPARGGQLDLHALRRDVALQAGSAFARRSRDAGDRPPGDRSPVAGNPRPGSRRQWRRWLRRLALADDTAVGGPEDQRLIIATTRAEQAR